MNIGMVGSGMIVNDCLEALCGMENITCQAICVRAHSVDRGKELADKYKIKSVYTDYEVFLQDDELKVVYVGIINSEHYSFSRRALLAGKHVVLEKPFTLTVKEAKELAQLAVEKGLFLFEAITTLYFPNYDKIKEHMSLLGDIKMVQCNFSQYSSRYDKYLKGEIAPAFDPEVGGGALYDLNVYHIHFVLGLFGKPRHVSYRPNLGYNGVDTSGVLILEYPGFTAQCIAAKDSSSPHFAMIQGTKGYLRVDGQVSICPSVELCLGNEVEEIRENIFPHRMQHEWDAFVQCIEKKDYDGCYRTLEHSVEVMKVIEEALKNKS